MLNAPHLESSQTSQTEEESMQLQQHCEKLLAQLEKQQSQIETLIEQNNRLLQLLQQKI
jgi:light-regulated signal transduction histidine kinase (bacteriophytochrome)